MRVIRLLVVVTISPLLLPSKTSGDSKPWTWVYYKDGKCLKADQSMHRGLVQLLTQASEQRDGCKYITPEQDFDFRGVECTSGGSSQIVVLSTSPENCRRDRRVLALLQQKWFGYIQATKQCVPATNINGQDMSPWHVIARFPKCKEDLIRPDLLQLDCRKSDIGAFLHYAATVEGCEAIRASMQGAQE